MDGSKRILYQKTVQSFRSRKIQQDQSDVHSGPEGAGLPRSIVLGFESGTVSYDRLPPHRAEGFTSTSQSFAFGVSFSGHDGAVLGAPSDRPTTRSFAPGTVGLNGIRPLTWLQVDEPSEGLEIHPGQHVLASVADATGCDWGGLDRFLLVEADAVIWAACARFRTAAIGANPLTGLEADTLIQEVAHHVALRYLGGRPAHPRAGRLHQRRLTRACAYIRENLHRRVSLAELSSVAAMSPFHFQRTFKRTTGMSPADYMLAMRAERAYRELVSGATLSEAGAAIGIRDGSYLRRLLKRFVG